MKRRKFIPRWRQFFLCSFLVTLLWSSPVLCAEVTLAWDPNSEADLAGYGIYFREGSAGPPYSLAGNVTLDELDNPNAPSFTVTGLEEGTRYYFAATAFDIDDNESGYSTAVCADIAADGTISVCSSSSGTSTTGGSSGGGGGGGGCFITSAAQGPESAGNPMNLLLVLAGGMACLLAMWGRERS